MKNLNKALLILGCAIFISSCTQKLNKQYSSASAVSLKPWPTDKTNKWYKKRGWLVGSNFTPSTAVNQLEMWQAETFDPATIDRELGWAADIGFNSMRVFLHDQLWEQDSAGFINRIDKFLSIADKHDIGVMFVLLNGVWDPQPKLGKQKESRPRVHMSGWVQSPGVDILRDTTKYNQLGNYVKGVMTRFANDKRVDVWDLYNHPENKTGLAYMDIELANKEELSLILLKKCFRWAREVNASQPITCGFWLRYWNEPGVQKPLLKVMLDNSDILTFHNYDGNQILEEKLPALLKLNRPLLCTEYMARGNNSFFEKDLPILKKCNVGAYNWGLVAGKTNANFHWDSWYKKYPAEEPEVWFHDIFRKDGTPYNKDEVAFIKRIIKE